MTGQDRSSLPGSAHPDGGDRRAEADALRAQVNARLDGCDHPLISDEGDGWACERCGQPFIPLFEEPVRPRADSTRSRLSTFQEW
jgi:hypothetical protein